MAETMCNQAKWIQAGLKIGEHLKEIEKISEHYGLGYIGIGVFGNQFTECKANALHIDIDGTKREVVIVKDKIRLYENGREFYMQA